MALSISGREFALLVSDCGACGEVLRQNYRGLEGVGSSIQVLQLKSLNRDYDGLVGDHIDDGEDARKRSGIRKVDDSPFDVSCRSKR